MLRLKQYDDLIIVNLGLIFLEYQFLPIFIYDLICQVYFFKIPNFGQSYGTRNILPTFLFKSPIMGTTLQQVVELDGSCLLKGWLTLRPRGFRQCRAPSWLLLSIFSINIQNSFSIR